MVKFLWDKCVTRDLVRYMYKIENYAVISKPNITYQKANEIVKNFINEDKNQINYLKFKIEEKFKLIHYIYSLLFSKIYNRTNHFGIQNKTNFDFYFQTWKSRKQNRAVEITQLQIKQNKSQLKFSKNPKDYQDREVNEN